MAYYMVSYDLRRELNEEDHERLHDHIRSSFSDWAWPLKSVWIVEGPSSAAVHDKIAPELDENDGLIVAELSGSLCFDKTQEEFDKTEEEAETNGWLRARFACR